MENIQGDDRSYESENVFIEGMTAGKNGLPIDTCPYQYYDSIISYTNKVCAVVNWKDGWAFGEFVRIQRCRKELRVEIENALDEMFSYEDKYRGLITILNRGFLKSGLRYFRAKKEIAELARCMYSSHSGKLLKELRIQIYWQRDTSPYCFWVFDKLIDVFGNTHDIERPLRALVERYGEKHGVKDAWTEYVYSEPLKYFESGKQLTNSS